MAFIDWSRWAELNKDKGEEMAAKTLQETQGVFGKADSELARAGSGKEYNASAIEEADAKRKALQSISGIQGQQAKAGGSLFDAALTQGSQMMGNALNAYSQMGDAQQRLKDAQKRAAEWKQRTDETARRHALAQMAQSEKNAAEIAEFDRKRAEVERERRERGPWTRYDSDGDYAGYSDYRERERQKSKPTRQKSIWDFFGR